MAIGAVFYGKKVKGLRKTFQDELATASSAAEETISNIRTVRSFSNEAKACDGYNEAIQASYGIGKTLALVQGLFAGGTAVFAQLAVLLVLWYGGVQVRGWGERRVRGWGERMVRGWGEVCLPLLLACWLCLECVLGGL